MTELDMKELLVRVKSLEDALKNLRTLVDRERLAPAMQESTLRTMAIQAESVTHQWQVIDALTERVRQLEDAARLRDR
jgi:hypothetical protein